MFLTVQPVQAEVLRIGLWHESLSRDGPGLLLRDLQKDDAALLELAALVRQADPDILVLTKIDFDASGLAARAFADAVAPGAYPFVMALRSNEGVPSGMDLDGDGRGREPEDAQGYGLFPGQGGLAVLSRVPIEAGAAVSHNDLLWRDVPGSRMRPSDPGGDVQRLSSGGHWSIPVALGGAGDQRPTLWLMVGHSGPPVFDGPEDRNGRRNLDELRLWTQILAGRHGPAPGAYRVFAAQTNLDPEAGEGARDAMRAFLDEEGFHDPLPGAATAYWANLDPLRVSYLLPSKTLELRAAQRWPRPEGVRHHLLTIDIAIPEPVKP